MAKFGVTTPMVSIVLSVFMAGLGIGSWGGGTLIRRVKQTSPSTALRLYGLLEILIGISSLLVPVILNAGYSLLRDTGTGFAWRSSFYYLASGGWVAIALLPWCACMGATFPFAMAAIRATYGEESQHSFSYLYLANVLGAVLGTLVPALVLIELFGFQGTLHIAGTLNGLLAAGVFLLSFSAAARSPMTMAPAIPKPIGAPGKGVLWLLFTTGICSMAIEVVWIREFTIYLGNVVYAFATILALYLLATFLGSAVYRKRAGAWNGGAAWICLGLAALLPLVFADPRFPTPDLSETELGSIAYNAVRAALAIGPFSGLAGFLTPMLVDRWSQGDPNRAGRAYAVNVLGSILGPLVAGFWVLPWMGERWGLCLISIPLFAAGLVSARRSSNVTPAFVPAFLRIGPGPLYACAAGLSVLMALLARSYDSSYPQRVELRDYTATVIATGEGMERQLLVNGIGMTRLTPITKLMAHVPLTMLSRPATNGLVICFGMGTTFRSMVSWGIRTTVVDLVPSVPKMFGYYHSDGPGLLKSPLVHVVIDDGRRFLERSPEQFDAIVTDPPPPIGAPTSSLLYSQEFYAIVKPHLRPGGILQIWCPGGDDATLAAITKALRNAFPYVRAYQPNEGQGIHFLASMTPLRVATGEELAGRLPDRAARDLVEWNRDTTPAKMLSDVLSRERPLESLIWPDPSVLPITDDRPINEYFLLRSAHAGDPFGTGAITHYLRGVSLMGSGHDSEAIYQFEEALRVKPNYPEAHNKLGTLLAKMPDHTADAISHFEAALRLNPYQVEAHNNLGVLLARMPGRTADAISHFEAALRLNPYQMEAHNNLGIQLARMPGRTADAISHFEAALRLNPYQVEAHNNLGILFARMPGRSADAISHFEAVTRLDPKLAQAQRNLGMLLLSVPGRTPEAIAHLEAAQRLQPDPELKETIERLQARGTK